MPPALHSLHDTVQAWQLTQVSRSVTSPSLLAGGRAVGHGVGVNGQILGIITTPITQKMRFKGMPTFMKSVNR